MQAVLEVLKTKPIMGSKDIFILRDYIGKKYPDSNINERANILANAVHRIIDGHLQEFNDKYRFQIRESLLRKAVSKNHYAINNDDIFKTCIAIHNHEEDYTEALTGWVNRQQEISVSRETLTDFINKVHHFAGNKLEHDWSIILECLKNSEFEPETVHLLPKLDISKTVSRLWERVAGVCRHASGAGVIKIAYPVMAVILIISTGILFQPLLNLPASFPKMIVSKLMIEKSGIMKSAKRTEILKADLQYGTAIPNGKAYRPTTQSEVLLEDLLYKEVDASRLKQSLINRSSTLAEEPYLSVIVQAAKEFNVNPIFLFAIAGQEQSFVPRQDRDAVIIANNPFNVYHSWTEYNTNIQDSARIASVTLSNLLRTKPETVDPLTWINQHYSEDNKWQIGVSRLFRDLSKEVDE
ncbi:MAG: hypothetical protein A4E55_02131 [Pelotomaculum sp. PtaU1.Bin035]|nr:MAG: hypothetical protein A4E55_02131 [Pelotomaculum sp. PtaU1.Bin035]